MSRPRHTTPRVEVHLMMPVDTMARVNLALFSPLQNRVPLGHLAQFFDRAAKELLDKLEGDSHASTPEPAQQSQQ